MYLCSHGFDVYHFVPYVQYTILVGLCFIYLKLTEDHLSSLLVFLFKRYRCN